MNKVLHAIGFVSPERNRAWMNPSPFLPTFSFHELHESDTLHAAPEDIIEAVASLDMREDRVANVLLSIRELPGKLMARIRNNPARPAAIPFGFHSFTLLERTSCAITLGLAGRFWRPDLDLHFIPTAGEFLMLADPGVARLVVRFEVVDHADGLRSLRTETFVHCPSTRTRRLFTPYWLAIRLGSGWIRRRTLATIRRRLQRHPGTPAC